MAEEISPEAAVEEIKKATKGVDMGKFRKFLRGFGKKLSIVEKAAKYVPGLGTEVAAGAGIARKVEQKIEPVIGGLAAAQKVTPTAQPTYAPPPSSAKKFALLGSRSGLVILFGIIAFGFLRKTGNNTLATLVLVATILFGLVLLILKHSPESGWILIMTAGVIGVFLILGMLTPYTLGLILLCTICAVLHTFDKFKELIDGFFSILLIGGGPLLTIGLMAMGLHYFTALIPIPLEYVSVITTMLMLVWILIAAKKWGFAIGLLIFILYGIFFFFLFLAPDVWMTQNSPMYPVVMGQQKVWTDFFTGAQEIGEEAVAGVRREYAFITGDYETSVEAQGEKNLGVFLEDVGTTTKNVRIDGKIQTYATLRAVAEGLDPGTKFLINVSCYPDTEKEKFKNEPLAIVRPKSEFEVWRSESIRINCLINAVDVGYGNYNIITDVNFDFVTNAFLRTYWMEQDRIRALSKEGVTNPLSYFNIKETSPIAVHTGGPVKIGIGMGDQVPYPLSYDAVLVYGPIISINLENQWRGEIEEVKNISISVPPGIEIYDIDGHPLENYPEDAECSVAFATEEQTCVITGALLKKFFTKEKLKELYASIQVYTIVTDIPTILAEAPLAIRSIKVSAEYKYRLKKGVPINVIYEKVVSK